MAGVLAVLQNGTVCTAAEDAVLENDPVAIEEGIIIQDEAEDTLLQEEEEEVISQEGFSLPEETEVLNSSEDAADANPQRESAASLWSGKFPIRASSSFKDPGQWPTILWRILLPGRRMPTRCGRL